MNNCKQCKNIKEYIPQGCTNIKNYCLYKKAKLTLKEMKNNTCFNIDTPELCYDKVKDILKRIYEEKYLDKEVSIPLFYAYLENSINVPVLGQKQIIDRFLSEYIPSNPLANLKKPYFKTLRNER